MSEKPKKEFKNWQIWLWDNGITVSNVIIVVGFFVAVIAFNLSGGGQFTGFLSKPILVVGIVVAIFAVLFLVVKSYANLKR